MKLKPFTLIIGENNIGKTNLLNALGLIFSNEISFFKHRKLEIDDINHSVIEEFKKEVFNNIEKENPVINFPEILVEVEMTDFNKDQQAVVSDWFIDTNFDTAKLKYSFTYRKSPEEWIDTLQKKNSKTKIERYSDIDFPINDYYYTISGGNSTTQVDSYFLRMLKMEFLNALRDAKRELVAGNDYRLLYRILANHGFEKYSELKNDFQTLNEKVDKNETLKEIIKAVEQKLEKYSLDTEEKKLNFKFSSIEISEILKRLSLGYANSPTDVSRNGLGRNNLLYISLVLSQLKENVNPESEIFFRLVAIEEPEAHLHAHLQKHFSQGLRNEKKDLKKQIILTSHSTHIASKLDLDNTSVLFNNQNGDIESHYFMNSFENNAKGKKQKRFIEKYLDATNSSMFFARKIILVEGAAEEILIPEFFKLYTKQKFKVEKTLEQIGCTLINVRGVAFKNFLELIKGGYYKKCLVLTDSDTGKKTENRAKNLQEDYQKQKEIIYIKTTKEDTFEKDIISENISDKGKNILLETLKYTRPNNYKSRWEGLKEDIDISLFFNEIEPKNEKGIKTGDYKADFAYFLATELNQNLNIPQYIKDGFKFICDE